jgi:hypothetical protein
MTGLIPPLYAEQRKWPAWEAVSHFPCSTMIDPVQRSNHHEQ